MLTPQDIIDGLTAVGIDTPEKFAKFAAVSSKQVQVVSLNSQLQAITQAQVSQNAANETARQAKQAEITQAQQELLSLIG